VLLRGQAIASAKHLHNSVHTFIGMGASLLLKDNVLLALVLSFLVIGTTIFIERKWLDEKIFKKKKWYAIAGYSALADTLSFFVFQPLPADHTAYSHNGARERSAGLSLLRPQEGKTGLGPF